MNQSKINFEFAFKLEGRGDGVTFIMRELCGVRLGNYDWLNWKQAMFGERIPKKI